MKCLIRTDLGGIHGMGHASRCRALAQALAARGADVRFLTRTLPLAAFVAPFAHETSLGAVDEQQLLAEAVARWRPDALVLDHPSPNGEDVLSEIDARWCPVVRLDHPEATPASCSRLIAPGAHWESATVERLRADFGPRFLYGWEYVLLDDAVTSHPPIPYAARQDGLIVFCAGGSDPTGALRRMVHWGASLPINAPKIFLTGHYATDRPVVATVEPFERRWLRQAALVVTLLGQTAYECLYWHVPTLCFARTREDVPRLEVLSEASDGALVPCGWFDHATPAWFGGLVQGYWERPAHRAIMAATSAGLLDGQGTARVADAILELA